MIKYLKTETYGDLPVRISYYAMKKYQEQTGKSLMNQFQNGFSDMMSGDLEHLLFYSLRRGFQVDKKEFKLEMKDMEDILDESFFEFIKLIPEFFPQAEEDSKNQQKKSQSKSQSQKK